MKGRRPSQIGDARLRASRSLFAWLSLYGRRPSSGESNGRAGEI